MQTRRDGQRRALTLLRPCAESIEGRARPHYESRPGPSFGGQTNPPKTCRRSHRNYAASHCWLLW
jgi:hypothetical protein